MKEINTLFVSLAVFNFTLWLLAQIVANPVEVGRVCGWLCIGFMLLAGLANLNEKKGR